METRYLLTVIFDDTWYKHEVFDTEEEAKARYHHLLETRLDDITRIEVDRQDYQGYRCKQTSVIKAIL